jgi:hypothetical protein
MIRIEKIIFFKQNKNRYLVSKYFVNSSKPTQCLFVIVPYKKPFIFQTRGYTLKAIFSPNLPYAFF